MAKIRIDLDKCIKAGECYYNHPGLFKVGKDGFPTVLVENPKTPEELTEAQAAVDVCPAAAILLDE